MSDDFDQSTAAHLRQEWIRLLDYSTGLIRHCIGQLSSDQIWWRPGPEQNSIGILIRHLAGNLNQWVVDGVSEQKNSRDREAEFASAEQEYSEKLLSMLEHVVNSAKQVLNGLEAEHLTQQRSIQEFDVTVTRAVMHSTSHFVGHTHQIVQLTRMQLGDAYRFQWTPDTPRDRSVPV